MCFPFIIKRVACATARDNRQEEASLVPSRGDLHSRSEWGKVSLDSVQAQTYPNLIHVVSDNASTDETAEILARYHNARVPVVTSRSGVVLPQMANWNRAIDLAPKEARWIRLLARLRLR